MATLHDEPDITINLQSSFEPFRHKEKEIRDIFAQHPINKNSCKAPLNLLGTRRKR
jgi:hypothetical protein